jgi:glycosyltransferase involved in cell wall biosynthesis
VNPGSTPLVSILTPSLNQGEFIADCLRSVARQTYPTIEHLVFDGGSTDDTLEHLKGASFPGLRWESRSDRGQADALNRAYANSRGEVIGWLNADDAYFDARAVEIAVNHFARARECGVVFGDVIIIDGRNRLVRHHQGRLPRNWTQLSEHASPLAQPAVFIRRSALGADTFLRTDLHVAMDLELWLRLHRAGVRFDHVSRILAVDREHPQRKVHRLRELRVAENKILAAAYGVAFDDRHHSRFAAWRRRVIGAAHLVQAPRRYTPAIDVDMRPVLARVARQLLLDSRSAIARS